MSIRPGDRLGPWWLERQREPDSSDFIPGPAGDQNLTHRTWTTLGAVGQVGGYTVDPRGLVTPGGRGWSLDWWIGADDRWHLPSQEVAVRQRLVGTAPVVETAMRIPGGDALHRTFALAGSTCAWALVEIENATPVPFAVALALRPFDLLGAAEIASIEVADEGRTFLVNGQVALVLPKAPARAASSDLGPVDVVHTVVGGSAAARFDEVHSEDRQASAALIFPLPHTAVLRAMLPLPSASAAGVGPRRSRRERAAPVPPPPDPVPTIEQVANGWSAHAERALRLSIPDDRLAEALAVNRSHLLVGTPDSDARAAALVVALAEVGATGEAAEMLGWFGDEVSFDEHGLCALGTYWRLTRDPTPIEPLVGPAARSAHELGKWLVGRRTRRHPQPLTRDRVAATVHALGVAADAMAGVAQPDVAAHMLDMARLGAGALRDLADASHESASPTEGPAVVDRDGRAGLDVVATLDLARHELAEDDDALLGRLGWLLDAASATWTWPSVLHPRTGGGSAGSGHDITVAAGFVSLVRHLLVDERERSLSLCPVLPTQWYGQGFEVHDAPTAFGTLGFAVRWHGDRPALLWELETFPGVPEVHLVAPGLDPTWSSSERRGDALLAAVPAPGCSDDVEAAVVPDDRDPPAPGASSSFS